MKFTQLELKADSDCEVWWLPAKQYGYRVGEAVYETQDDVTHRKTWRVIQVCVTLDEEDIPTKARIAMSNQFI